MLMLITIFVRRKIVWQRKHRASEKPYFHCGPSIRVKQEKNVEIFI